MEEEAVNYTEQMELTRIITGMNSATEAADYADTIILEPEQITGSRYKYILTNEEDPGV